MGAGRIDRPGLLCPIDGYCFFVGGSRMSLSIITIPVPAVDVADNDVIQEVVGNKNDTASGTSLVSLNKQQQAQLTDIEGKVDALGSETATVDEDIVVGLNIGASEVTVLTIPVPSPQRLHALYIALLNMTANGKVTVKLKTQINGNLYTFWSSGPINKADVPEGWPLVDGTLGVVDDVLVTVQSTDPADIGVDMNYTYLLEELE